MTDADGDTIVNTEESSDEDIIRFDSGGTEVLTLNSSATATNFGFTSVVTTADAMVSTASSLTTGSALVVTSNSAETDVRNLVSIVNSNSAAVGTVCFKVTNASTSNGILIDQNGEGVALEIDSEATTEHTLHISNPTNTTANVLHIANCNALTTGSIASFVANGADTTARNLVFIHNKNTAAVGAIPLHIRQDAAANSLTIDHNSTSSCILITSPETTTGTGVLNVSNCNALTTGSVAYLHSDSADATARYLLRVVNDNAAAVGTVPLIIQQDAPTSTNFKHIADFGGLSLWISDGTTADGALSGTAGDICLNGGTGVGQTAYCDITGTNWTDM